jgi:cytochrome c peroxidase
MLRNFYCHNLLKFCRQKWRVLTLSLLFVACLAGVLLSQLLSAGTAAVLPEPQAVVPIAEANEFDQPILPLPLELKLDHAKVALGKRLFHEPRLSRNGQMSCASCHDLKQGGADGVPQSIGMDGKPLLMNSPTILNSAFNFRQFWDGRVLTLEDQVNHPLNAVNELGLSWEDVVTRLRSDEDYRLRFAAAYKQGITPETMRDAIATFQRSLITPARFDQFLRGDQKALSDQEKVGYEKFQSYGCVTCHQGVNLGGNMFQSLGVMRDYFSTLEAAKDIHQGRMNITGDNRDRHVFKVPTLRNIVLTAPYLHDGHVATLPEVIRIMAQYQLGRDMPEADVADIVAFLQSLTGNLPGDLATDDAADGAAASQSQAQSGGI